MKARENLKKTRMEKGMTQEELASAVGIARPFLAHIEQGRYNPSLFVALSLSAILGKPVEFLFCEEFEAATRLVTSYQKTSQRNVSPAPRVR
ncbi:MAG TPA: helix-turn-helix transcriptional regulator [Alicyclobacillus sp.]|nr:helix-turn-helix transcriptional regulator [Alicyclobacillus sp.]